MLFSERLSVRRKVEAFTIIFMAGENHSLLIVEDNRETQLILKAIFRNKYKTSFAETVSDAVYQISSKHFDLILLDLNLNTGGNGKTLLLQIRNDEQIKNIPVIITTAYDVKPGEEEFFQKNANGFLAKPINKKLLLQTVENLLKIS
ncbi:MAG: response regulator [bacterium]|nr:response regulator [bacterium]